MERVLCKDEASATARRQSDRPSKTAPLTEHIASGVKVHGTLDLKINKKSDTAITFCCQRLARKANENYRNSAEHITAVMREFQGATRCSVYWEERDEERAELVHRLSVLVREGGHETDESRRSLADPSHPAFQAFKTCQPTIIDYEVGIKVVFDNLNMDDDRCEVFPISREEGRGSVAVIPIYYRINDKPIGVAIFEGDLRCKGSDVDGFGKTFWSAQLAIAAAVQIGSQLTLRVNPTTNTTGSIDFDVDFKEGIRRLCDNRSKNLYLFLIDLDDFKQVNEKHDYMTGDRVLLKASEAIKSAIRPSDQFHRIHGEEFGVVCSDVKSDDEAIIIAERIRKRVSELAVPSLKHPGQKIKITCSIGITNVDKLLHRPTAIGEHANELIDRVYAAAFCSTNDMLQVAKSKGKDCLVSN